MSSAAGRPLRVAMVHYRDSAVAGGSLRVGETIASHLDPQRVAAEMIFAYGPPGPVAGSARVPCHFIEARGPKDFGAWLRARSVFKKLQPDIIHFQDGVVWLRAALMGTPAKTLVHVHARVARGGADASPAQVHPFKASRMMRAFLKFTDGQVCINNGARKALLDLGWVQPATSWAVYNSINVKRFAARHDKDAARLALGLPQDALLLGMLCRLVWWKGCADLFSIIERLPERWHGVICGDGPDRDYLRSECAKRGLAHRVHFISTLDDVAPLYSALDAYAFLSRYEPFGLVLAEAMAAGVPVFGIEGEGEFNESDYPLAPAGVGELLPFANGGNYQSQVPPQLFDQLASRIAHYGEAPESFADTIVRARGWVESCFAAPVQAEAMTYVYEDVGGRAGPAHALLRDLYRAKRAEAEARMLNAEAQVIAATA